MPQKLNQVPLSHNIKILLYDFNANNACGLERIWIKIAEFFFFFFALEDAIYFYVPWAVVLFGQLYLQYTILSFFLSSVEAFLVYR